MVQSKILPINCDCGEGLPGVSDDALIRHVDACNIAIGGHAGDEKSIINCLEACQKWGVLVGAHPSYPDIVHFGRRSISISSEDFKVALCRQFDLVISILDKNRISLHHIKAHGALYHDLSSNEYLSKTYLEVVETYWGKILILAMSDSPFAQFAAQNHFPVWQEGFPDRAYQQKDRLLARSEEGAIISDPLEIIQQIVNMNKGQIRLQSQVLVDATIDTCCLHGDHPHTLTILESIAKHFKYTRHE
jgi:UPF0271 protein